MWRTKGGRRERESEGEKVCDNIVAWINFRMKRERMFMLMAVCRGHHFPSSHSFPLHFAFYQFELAFSFHQRVDANVYIAAILCRRQWLVVVVVMWMFGAFSINANSHSINQSNDTNDDKLIFGRQFWGWTTEMNILKCETFIYFRHRN